MSEMAKIRSAERVVQALVDAFKGGDYRGIDPRDASTFVFFTASDGNRSMRPLTYGEIANAIVDAGLVSEASDD